MDSRGGKGDDYWSQSSKFDDVFARMDDGDVWEDPGALLTTFGQGSIESEIAAGSRGTASDVRSSAFIGARSVASEPQQEKVTKLMAELKLMNRKYQDRFAPMPTETVRCIMMGRPYSLECYKTFADKTSLLDEAVYSGDGNAIFAAILHLKKTVKKSILVKALLPRPVAAQHLIHHMKQRAENNEVIWLLNALGKKEEASIWQYKLAVEQDPPEQQVKALKTVLKDCSLPEADRSLANEHFTLLERVQIPVDSTDVAGNVRTVSSRPNLHLVGTSLQDTLYYCVYFHWGVGENHLASPSAIKRLFQMREKEWHWPVLKALTDRKQWVPIMETFVVKKTLLRGARLRGEIPAKQILSVLREATAPESLIAAILAASPSGET